MVGISVDLADLLQDKYLYQGFRIGRCLSSPSVCLLSPSFSSRTLHGKFLHSDSDSNRSRAVYERRDCCPWDEVAQRGLSITSCTPEVGDEYRDGSSMQVEGNPRRYPKD